MVTTKKGEWTTTISRKNQQAHKLHMLHSRLREINRWHTLLFPFKLTYCLTIDTQHRYKLAITAFFSRFFTFFIDFFSAFAYTVFESFGLRFFSCYHLDSFLLFYIFFSFPFVCIVFFTHFLRVITMWCTRKIPEAKWNREATARNKGREKNTMLE